MTSVGMVTIGPSVAAAAAATATTTIILLLLIAATPSPIAALELEGCGVPLGMESGTIKDAAVTASSAYDAGSVGPQHGRLRNDKNGGAWCPRQMVSRDAKEYLEINLEELHVISGSRTQGRFGNGQGQEYAEEYMLDYWRPNFQKWVRWKNRTGKELLPGNTDTSTIVDQKLDPPIIASKIRFLPYSDHVRTVCMRVELIGCRWADGLLGYATPQGYRRGPDWDLTDRTYDGREEAGRLVGGLGQLVDGQKGQDNFRLDLSGHGKGYEWVGWRNDTPGWAGHPLEMLFEFDKVRNFSAAHLHTNNLFGKDVQVFSHARAFFSTNGDQFTSEPVHFSYMPDLVLVHARNVTIKLHHRLGRFIKLQLYFAARWILLSEVSFDSVAVTGNFTEAAEDVPLPESGREYPLQRDEVKSSSGGKPGRNNTGSSAKSNGDDHEESKHYIGFVIGILTVVILILVVAIVFIVFRNQKLKITAGLTVVPTTEDRIKSDKMSMEDCDKSSLYVENCRTNLYTRTAHPGSPDYTEVPDLVCQNFTPPHVKSGQPFTPSSRAPPPMLNFLPKPPPVPPPPESYYSARDILPLLMASPVGLPASPPHIHRSNIGRHFMLPLSPEPEDCSEPDEKSAASATGGGATTAVMLESFPRERLRIIEKLGEGQFGDVHLCEVTAPGTLVGGELVVVVHTLRLESFREEFEREVRALARLDDPNVARLLGACLDSEPVCAIREYAPMGDLCQFLQDHVAESATPLAPTARTLSYGCLIYMATQIASGMKYLESLRYVHKDLAARNCLVGRRYEIKVSDVGSYRQMYSSDYCQIADSRPLPVRWMAWESLLLGKFTSKSDVWSFAVLLWEIMTYAREQPFEDLSDDGVVENVTHFYQDDGKHVLLSAPISSPKEIFDLMCECWQRNESDRPNFREIHLFLQRKNLGYNPDLH